MRKICVINHKGGVGKTTTTINLAQGLGRAGRRVLVIDLDPQGNVAQCLGIEFTFDVYDYLIHEKPIERCIYHEKDFDVMPTRETLTKAEMILAGEQSRETFLRRKLDSIADYDYVLLDCPPSLGLLNQNALLYATEAVVPTATDALGVQALRNMMEAVETINEVFDHALTVSIVVPTLYDARVRTCKEALADIHSIAYERVSAPIRTNAKLREAPRFQRTILDHDHRSRGAQDYQLVIEMLLQQENGLVKPVESVAVKA